MGYSSGERINVRNSCLLGSEWKTSWVSRQRNSLWILGGRFVSMHDAPKVCVVEGGRADTSELAGVLFPLGLTHVDSEGESDEDEDGETRSSRRRSGNLVGEFFRGVVCSVGRTL